MSGQADLSMEASKLEYMTHEELIRMFILDVISDDYEEIEKIEGETKKLADHAGVRTNSAEIRGALIELIEMGLARAYRLSSTLPAQEVKGTPAPGEISGYYFWTTEKGKEVQAADLDSWPFDEEGFLREDWVPPSPI